MIQEGLKYSLLSLFFLLFSLHNIMGKGKKEIISIAAIDWCPQICLDQKRPGYLIEIIRTIFDNSPYEVDYRVYNWKWSRAIKEVARGKYDALLSPAKEEAPNLLYHNIPIGFQTHCIWISVDSTWEYKDSNSLLDKKIIIYKDHSYGEFLKEYFAKNKNWKSLEFPYDSLFIERAKKLISLKRADAFLFTYNSVKESIAKKAPLIKENGCFKKDPLWLALSPLIDKKKVIKLKAIIDQRMEFINHSGDYDRILRKYNIHHPQIK